MFSTSIDKLIFLKPQKKNKQKRTKSSELINELYLSHAANLRKYLQKNYGLGPPEPEDVVQNVFAKFSQLENLTQIENPKAYIYKMAVNYTLNELERVKRVQRFICEKTTIEEREFDLLSPEKITENRRELMALNNAVERLPNKQREIFIRSRILGHTYTQISDELNYSVADISRQLCAALFTLQQANTEGEQ